MTTDYVSIKADNERRYGTDIGRIGRMLLADRYDDRTHFIFELLQNAEDALARRLGWQGSRAVRFALFEDTLRVSHSGKPFDDRDVRGICGIAESTKDLTAIGRFGIGFKSVYAFTGHPEVHSGDQDFAIDSYVWPVAVPPIKRDPDKTVFVLPLIAGEDDSARQEIAKGLERLGPRSLLFLRQIEEIAWRVKGGPSGLYLRGKPEEVGANTRRVSLIGEQDGKPDTEETWLVFSREVRVDEATLVGQVELAFSLAQGEAVDQWSVQSVSGSPLVVFFPTVVETHLGFLVQGPYRTTPSRDNVPRNDAWNQFLVKETTTLLVIALRWLRDHDLLNSGALRCLPLDRVKFVEGSMFASLFEAVRIALRSEPFLPRFGVGHIAASKARLARTQELRELFDTRQLGVIFGAEGELVWLSGEITQDRTPELRQYLMHELGVAEVTPETILPKLGRSFLESQPDNWVLDLYEFLNGQPALFRQGRLQDVPLIRLEDGVHVTARANGQPQAFLPSAIKTGFPTVRRSVCASKDSRKFLESLGLTEPDPVDDVVWNVLPRYGADEVNVDNEDYEADIRRIVAAFGTDSKTQREKLVAALRDSTFVMVVDAGDGTKAVSKPSEVYLATERLKALFAGVSDVLLVDDSYPCLRGENVRDVLEACGATRYLLPVLVEPNFTSEQRSKMRREAGCESYSGRETLEDNTLRGLDKLLGALPTLPAETRVKRAALLWEALEDVEDRRGTGAFFGAYRWHYYQPRSTTFDASFARQLNETAWVPDAIGDLQRPEFVLFDSLGWKANPFLLSKVHFKPPIIETLAKEAGIEPGVLDLLKKLGVTSEAALRALLKTEEESETPGPTEPRNVADATRALLGDTPGPTPPVPDPSGAEPSGLGGGGQGGGIGAASGSGPQPGRSGGGTGGGNPVRGGGGTGGTQQGTSADGHQGGKRTPGSTGGGRPFISYVGTHPDDEEPELDGLDQQARMTLEEQAIGLVTEAEPQLARTPTNNPGFDLTDPGPEPGGDPIRWIEVKAMTGDLLSRPVGLSRAQFECAQKHRTDYWLYIVERAGSPDQARIVRIQDPAGKARTFTFDHGWVNVAETGVPGGCRGRHLSREPD